MERPQTGQDVTDSLRCREPLFHREPPGSGRDVFEQMMTADFWEVGASGTVHPREVVADVVEHRNRDPADEDWTIAEFQCRHLAGSAYLVTYLLDLHGRRSRRCTLWEQVEGTWRAIYHQGTLVPS